MRMNVFVKINEVLLLILSVLYFFECKSSVFDKLDSRYHLVAESYKIAKKVFNQGLDNYNQLKTKSLLTIDIFLDLVYILNEEMGKELRAAILKFYKIKYFHDFTNYAMSMEEIIDITEHCLIEPEEKLKQIRSQFREVIRNFQDSRNFNTVDKCGQELPDEVAAAHCVLHQAVLFNETMQENLVSIVEIKTRQHALDMNTTLHGVQKCFNDFVPKFFDQLLVDAYTPPCGYMKVVNASITDLVKDNWRRNQTIFPKKWSPLVKLLKENVKNSHKEPLFLMLFSSNITYIQNVTV